MDSPTVELATNQQLIKELLGRTTFAGIIIHNEKPVTQNMPRAGDTLRMEISPGIGKLGAAIALTDAVSSLLKTIPANKRPMP
jgi:hypothetical protein